jgi:pyridine nucleotide-disulfide oxidoreductase family protein
MKKLLLVGGGHAHLYVVKKLQRFPIENVEITLISPDCHQYYSGMFSGYTEGLYKMDEIRINLKELAKISNVKWIEGVITSIDPKVKKVLTANGDIYSYDVISFDIGSLTAGTDLPGVAEYANRIKPNYHFVDVINEARNAKKVVVAGGGTAGIEISLSLTAWRKKNDIKTPVTLVSAGRLLQQEKNEISNKIEKIVTKKGIHMITDESVNRVERKALFTSSNKQIFFDKLIWLTGPKAPGLFKSSGLPIDDEGYLLVEGTLQVKKYPSIFGAGDCITLVNHPAIPKAGVYAVKQGPVLFNNIKGFFETGEGEWYKPQRNHLSILSTGNKEGFVLYRGNVFSGKWAWYLKNWIDKQFIKKYQH